MISPDEFLPTVAAFQADILQEEDQASVEEPLPFQKLKLSVLQRTYEKKHRYAALTHLRERAFIEIDGQYKHPNDGRKVTSTGPIRMDIDEFYLDFVMYTSRYLGLGAIIPNTEAHHHWTFTLSLKDQHHNFSPKHGLVGFETTGKMVYLGRCQQETVWIAFAPDHFVDGQSDPLPPDKTFPAPHVTAAQHWKFCLFMAKCLADLNIGGIYCTDPHADISEGRKFDESTNLL
jgi:hypothetical protein